MNGNNGERVSITGEHLLRPVISKMANRSLADCDRFLEVFASLFKKLFAEIGFDLSINWRLIDKRGEK